jgi:oxygen-independent coproporphyrinogen-3 oxidase
VRPPAISPFPHLVSQNQRQLNGYNASLNAGQLPVEPGLAVLELEVLERSAWISEVMGPFRVALELDRFAIEWHGFQALATDGLVALGQNGNLGVAHITNEGRWLIRTIAAVFDPSQRQHAGGSRLI